MKAAFHYLQYYVIGMQQILMDIMLHDGKMMMDFKRIDTQLHQLMCEIRIAMQIRGVIIFLSLSSMQLPFASHFLPHFNFPFPVSLSLSFSSYSYPLSYFFPSLEPCDLSCPWSWYTEDHHLSAVTDSLSHTRLFTWFFG